jgi:pyruvate/2-oxoglutarate/acetoin dehydrogenase E1 component
VIRVSAGNVPWPVAAELEAEVAVSPARVVDAARRSITQSRPANR